MKVFKFVVLCLLVLSSYGYMNASDEILPYILKAPETVTIDGNLDEWNYCFPFDLNSHTITENDNRGWTPIPADDDIHGTIKLMWDEENFYIGAVLYDDNPGLCPFIGTADMWNGDVFEILIGNYDVGTFPSIHESFIDTEDGKTDYQFTIAYTAEGAKFIKCWYNPEFDGLDTDDNMAVTIEDGKAIVEVRIPFDAIPASDNGNTFKIPAIGSVVPLHLQIYDVDEVDGEGNPTDFVLWGYGKESPFPWGSKVWPVGAKIVDNVLDAQNKSFISYEQSYCRKAPENMVMDGNLEEWNYCFPFDMNSHTLTENDNRGWTPIPADDDIHGTIRTMWDEENFYISAELYDDNPGLCPFIGGSDMWNGDVFEFLIGNYNVTELGVPSVHEEFLDTGDGKLDLQFTIAYTAEGAKFVKSWYHPEFDELDTDENMGVAIDGNRAVIEVRIPFEALPESESGNRFSIPEVGSTLPFHLQIYDVDNLDGEGNPTDFVLWGYGLGSPFPWGTKEWPLGLYITDLDDSFTTLATPVSESAIQPIKKNDILLSNYPNPFNPNTTIQFELNQASKVNLSVYNLVGQEVRRLAADREFPAGSHKVEWNGRDDMNASVPTGIYFYRLETDNGSRANKMLLLK